jgi:hypothetical protein
MTFSAATPASVEVKLLFEEAVNFRSAKLTWRDRDVLKFIDEQGYAFFDEIRHLGFPTDNAVRCRLSILVHAGWLRSISVAEIPAVMRMKYEWQKLGIAPESQDFFKKKIYYRNPLLQEKSSRNKLEFSVSMIQHQLALGHVRNILVRTLNEIAEDVHILTERHIVKESSKKNRYKLIPDLVISTDTKLRIAVEYERTQKDRSRYLQRFDDYDDSVYSHVLYFVETETIFEKIKELSMFTNRLGLVWVKEPNQIFKPRMGFISLEKFFGLNLR